MTACEMVHKALVGSSTRGLLRVWSEVPDHGDRGSAGLAEASGLKVETTQRYLRFLDRMGLVERVGVRNASWTCADLERPTFEVLEDLMAGRRKVNIRRQIVEESATVPGTATGNHAGNGAPIPGTVPGIDLERSSESSTVTEAATRTAVVTDLKSPDATATKRDSCSRYAKKQHSSNSLSNPTSSSASTVGSGITESANSDQRPVEGDLAATPLIEAGLNASPVAALAPLQGNEEGTSPLVLRLLDEITALKVENADLQKRLDEALRVKRVAAAGTPAQAALVAEVFADWQVTLGYPERTLTPERRKCLMARIREGATRDQFQKVWACAKKDPFLQGANDRGTKYDDITTLCKNRSAFERYLTMPVGDIRKAFSMSPNLMPKPASEIKEYLS
jgi:hypothetical protein